MRNSRSSTWISVSKRRKILDSVLAALSKKFYKPELLGPEWREAVDKSRPSIESAGTQEAFEQSVELLLQSLRTSHIGFFHEAARRASSRSALNAAYLEDQTPLGSRWIFQDVHAGGAAALAGVQPGHVLLAVNGKEIAPPEHPVFPMGKSTELRILGGDDQEQVVTVEVAKPNGKKLHFAEPTLVQARLIEQGAGYVKVAMFPGMVGVDIANEISTLVARLGKIKGLIVDLRGNTGGGVGALRLMSLLTPDKIPVGFAPGKHWAGRDLTAEKMKFPRFGEIPSSKNRLWLLGLRYLPSLIRQLPIVLESEGCGVQPYQGNVVLLVDRHTASAAEMITMFAKENRLATIVGERTAGRLLSATSVKVGYGYRLALPTGAYHTWKGTTLEGNPIDPDVLVEFDWQDRRRGNDRQFDVALKTVMSVPA